MLKISYTNALVFAAFAVVACLQPLATSAAPVPVLVELFTSEGCSDCPPADSFLKTLDSTQPAAGAHLIVLEEHVDYWDDLGWRDPFSSHSLTQRQEGYVSRLHLASAYTPQMVVDGQYQFVGSDRRSAAKSFEDARSSQKVGVRISSLSRDGEMFRFRIDTDPVAAKGDVLIVLADDHAESQVQHGENGGRHLAHVAVVRSLANIAEVEKGASFSKEISIDAKRFRTPWRLIVLLQEPNQGKILGAAVERLQN